ncbi:hypothetical protein [Modestobacter altitudinis]|uniref:hypothetical protein n=1 Tax=Modestobacter altitudinis TaxID=2213158 RepID=UPI00110CE535|nr:hypothetical protein [Modestobacter altitudinis]
MSRPVVPLSRVARLGMATAASSRSVLAASFGWLAVLAAVYAADAGPPLPALAATAALLLPVSAWATAAHLAATSADLRQVLVAADGPVRTLVADAVPALLWLLAATAAGVLADVAADPHPAPVGVRLLGALLHLLCGCVGVALALALHAGRVTRGVQALVVVAVSLASARSPWLPPAGPVLSTWGSGEQPGVLLAGWAMGGPVLVTAGLLAVTLRCRRRR